MIVFFLGKVFGFVCGGGRAQLFHPLFPQNKTKNKNHQKKGYVRTDLTGGEGWVSVDESADGVLRLLEDGRELHGRWYAFDGSEVPW